MASVSFFEAECKCIKDGVVVVAEKGERMCLCRMFFVWFVVVLLWMCMIFVLVLLVSGWCFGCLQVTVSLGD